VRGAGRGDRASSSRGPSSSTAPRGMRCDDDRSRRGKGCCALWHESAWWSSSGGRSGPGRRLCSHRKRATHCTLREARRTAARATWRCAAFGARRARRCSASHAAGSACAACGVPWCWARRSGLRCGCRNSGHRPDATPSRSRSSALPTPRCCTEGPTGSCCRCATPERSASCSAGAALRQAPRHRAHACVQACSSLPNAPPARRPDPLPAHARLRRVGSAMKCGCGRCRHPL
jgi:hypothetical protein